MSSLHILEVKPLSEVSFANIFSHMIGSLFILMLFSLAVQKLFYFDEISFVYSFPVSFALGDTSVLMTVPDCFDNRGLVI